MVCLGAHFSAIWIVVANSWMQTPAGYEISGEGIAARAVITDFWAMVFNPSSMTRLSHTVIGCWLAGAFLAISVGAYYILKNRHLEFAKNTLKVSLSVAIVACVLQLITGDSSGRVVAKYQPAKLAAIEGIYKTKKGAGLTLFGIPNTKEERLDYAVEIPYMLSLLSFHDAQAEIKGLDTIPKKDWPRVQVVFQTYHLMILTWVLMVISALLAVYYWRKGTLFQKKGLLKFLVVSAIFPQIGNQAGWVTAEMGRYPWIVQDLLRISEGLSKAVVAEQVLGSIILFGIVYSFLFVLFIYLLNEKFKHGPADLDTSTTYHQQYVLVNESPETEEKRGTE